MGKVVTKEYKKVHSSEKVAKVHEQKIKARGNVRSIEKKKTSKGVELKYKFFKK
ncbi:MAG: hypothetical protein KBG30_01635 [Bacteroidales bacterium]|jgi:hypothetical protein|nr:hypothetical protein [Bacteroidales bacterium]